MKSSGVDSASRVDLVSEEKRAHALAVAQAFFVTILWSSSWVIIKFGLEEIPPLTFAGLRYFIAAVILLAAIAVRPQSRSAVKSLSASQAWQLAGYGLVYITVTMGAQFVGLTLLPAITVSLLLNMTPLIVLILGVFMLKEVPTARQIGWVLVGICGVLLYFTPLDLGGLQVIGLIVVLVGVLSNSFSSIIGRAINRERRIPVLVVTALSMAIGSLVLLVLGYLFEPSASISALSWFYVAWLSVVNTAVAFNLWHRAMQTLRAVDMSIINGAMLPQIVILSVLFLGELPAMLDWIGLFLIGLSAFFVQFLQARRKAATLLQNSDTPTDES